MSAVFLNYQTDLLVMKYLQKPFDYEIYITVHNLK